jgi:hypothetical protein
MNVALNSPNKKSVSTSEIISVAVVIVAAVLMFWKNTDIRLSALEVRMNVQDKQAEVIQTKLDKLQESVNTINLSLQNKQDRK